MPGSMGLSKNRRRGAGGQTAKNRATTYDMQLFPGNRLAWPPAPPPVIAPLIFRPPLPAGPLWAFSSLTTAYGCPVQQLSWPPLSHRGHNCPELGAQARKAKPGSGAFGGRPWPPAVCFGVISNASGQRSAYPRPLASPPSPRSWPEFRSRIDRPAMRACCRLAAVFLVFVLILSSHHALICRLVESCLSRPALRWR